MSERKQVAPHHTAREQRGEPNAGCHWSPRALLLDATDKFIHTELPVWSVVRNSKGGYRMPSWVTPRRSACNTSLVT